MNNEQSENFFYLERWQMSLNSMVMVFTHQCLIFRCLFTLFSLQPSRNLVYVTSILSNHYRDCWLEHSCEWQVRGVCETTKVNGRCVIVVGHWVHWRYFCYYSATARHRNACNRGLVPAFYRTAVITIWPASLTKSSWFLKTLNLHHNFSTCML